MTSIRKKIEHAVGGEVELRVPPSDPTADYIKHASVFSDNIKALVDERNLHKGRSEWLLGQLQLAQQTIERLSAERDECQRQYMIMLRGNGELKSTLDGVFSLFQNARNMVNRVEHQLARLPKEQEPVELVTATEPTPEAIDQLRRTLNNLDGGAHEVSSNPS